MTDQPATHEAIQREGMPPVIAPRRRGRWAWGLAGLLLAGGLVGLALTRLWSPRRALPPGVSEIDYTRAARSWKQQYHRNPDDLDVFSWLAEGAVAAGDLERAVACFERIPSTHPQYGRAARHQQGEVLQKTNRLCAAERNLREFIELESHAAKPRKEMLIDAMQRLRSLLELELRFEDRHALLREMFRCGEGDVFDTFVYYFPSLLRWNGPAQVARAESAMAAESACFEVRRAIGRYRAGQGRLDESREILTGCLQDRPSDLLSFTFLLGCEYERGGTAAIADAIHRLAPPADDDPWLLLQLRGHVANDEQRFSDAVDCFERVLRIDPTNAECHQGIATACLGLKDTGRRERELRATAVLMRVQVRLARLILHDQAAEPILEIARACEELELTEQALAMARVGCRIYPHSGDFNVLHDRLRAARKATDPAP